MFLTRMLVVSLTLNVRLDLCLNFCLVTEIKYLGRNGRASCLILFASRNIIIFMLVAKSFHLSYHNSPSIPLYLQLHNISDHISFISTYYVSSRIPYRLSNTYHCIFSFDFFTPWNHWSSLLFCLIVVLDISLTDYAAFISQLGQMCSHSLNCPLNLCYFSFNRCAQEARYKQYTHFGVQHYGECYSGPESWKTYRDEGIRQDFTRPPDSQPWVGCVDESLNQCKQPSLECVGKQNTNFVYTVDQGNVTTTAIMIIKITPKARTTTLTTELITETPATTTKQK